MTIPQLLTHIRLVFRHPWCRLGLHRWGLWDDGLLVPSTPIERSDEDAAQQGTVDPGATPTTPPGS